jgi:hypothetical protein
MNFNLDILGLHSFMNCELIFAFLVLLIDIPLSLSLDYHSQMYSESVGGLALLPHDP